MTTFQKEKWNIQWQTLVLHLLSERKCYQVQTKIAVCDVECCDFCVFTFCDGEDDMHDFHIERIRLDKDFQHHAFNCNNYLPYFMMSFFWGYWGITTHH